jgi:hypothetical protein
MSARFRASRPALQVRDSGEDRQRSDRATAVRLSLAGSRKTIATNTMVIS